MSRLPYSRRLLAAAGAAALVAACAGTPAAPGHSSGASATATESGLADATSPIADPDVVAVWSATGHMLQARADDHTATLLADGRVLVAGVAPISAELYDPGTGTWAATASMADSRGYHSATLLDDGRVLVAGGDASALASAELYDPVGGTWSTTGSLAMGRAGHVAALLPDGRVLVAGGQDAAGVPSVTAELYDPASGSWTATGDMIEARVVPTITPLLDGRVLVAGAEGDPVRAATAELYDPATGTWTATPEMHEPRSYGTATRLQDGTVLVAGGGDRSPSAELYDPATGSWTRTELMNEGRSQQFAILLPDGTVLVGGGDGEGQRGTAELYEPVSGSWTLTGNMTEWRASPSATLLVDGRVLAAGGYTKGDSSTAELYDPTSRAARVTPPPWASRCELGCQGPIAPGTFVSTGFLPGLQLTFADGTWFNTADYPGELQFEQGSNVLRFLRDPGASSKEDELLAEVPKTPQGLTDWMVGNKDMVVSEPEVGAIGQGIEATTFTVEIAESNVNVDPGCPSGVRSCLSFLWIGEGHTYAIGYGNAVRFYLFTVDSGSEEQTIVATADVSSAADLAALTTAVTPILESLRLP